MNIKRIPRRFYDDHRDRDLPAPLVVRFTKTHYFIDADDPLIKELLDDAEFYSRKPWLDCDSGICRSARATINALS